MLHLRIAALALFAALSLVAQDTRARVQGLVADSTKAVIGGAAVTLTNTETNVASVTKTGDAGQYLFDYVLPGTYEVSVEMNGFRKFTQKNILVQSRADVTVNATLEIGSLSEAVTVEASPVAVQFNTSTMSMTIDRKMTNDMPIIHRNPFLLVSLNPATVIRSTTEQSPYHHWAATQFDAGGNTSTKNDIVVDGASNMASEKSSYTPSMDAVSEVNLQQNAVDAEFGHSAGGILTVNMKSGTNDFHGTAYYLGRNPRLNAVADHITRRANLTRNHVYGGTLGHPVLKNRLFNFVSFEGWRTQDPRNSVQTLPTTAERTGDFSQSLNVDRGMRTIYDPLTSQIVNGAAVRQPFAGNRIPAARIDPVSSKMIADLWQPNRPGDDAANSNNFRIGFAEVIKYWNFSDRADWNVNDKLKVFGRFSRFRTAVAQDNYTNSPANPPNGSLRHSWNGVGDVVYMINPSTVLNVRGAYNRIFDSFGVESALLQEADLQKFWASRWYESYQKELPQIYYPGASIRAGSNVTEFGRPGGYWYQDPDQYSFQSKVTKNVGKHYFKIGGEYRKQRVVAARPRPMAFDFRADNTAADFLRPNPRLNGDAWASMLLGVIDQNSRIQNIPLQRPRMGFYGLFFHDDYKITQKLTLNIGIRYEYQTAMVDPENRISRFLDLAAPIPEFQGANAPQLPASVNALRRGAPVYNGAWVFTDDNNRGSWNPQRALFMPRFGLAYRLGNQTALRFGYARYLVPAHLTDGLDILGSVFYPGFDSTTTGLPLLQGVPQAFLRDPFPQGLVPITGKSFGRYTNLGGPASWYNQDFGVGTNDRLNFTLEHQLPKNLLVNVTYFINLGRNHPFTQDMNLIDPRIGYEAKTAVTTVVDNPFFNKLPADKMPGNLRNQARISTSELLRPYPQYGSLQQRLTNGINTRYQALQLQVQRPFVNGFNLLVGYNYNRERNQEFYDDLDYFLNNLTWQPATNARHRLTGAAIYQLPFGKNRRWLSASHSIVDGVFGGWSVSSIFTFNTGEYLRFGGAIVNGDPSLDNPTKSRMFDTSKFAVLQPFTRRQNPLQYSGVKGPAFKNIDFTLAKEFQVMEKLKFELRMEAYNATNTFNGANPVTNITSPVFGSIVAQRGGYLGRQFQYSGRLVW